jgi:uncharacterized membrane protein YgdD (TMEM256/DUF423 family)
MAWKVAGVLGALGVALGAFGAHGLEGRVEPRLVEVWNTGARYHLLHALALLALATVAGTPRAPHAAATWLFVAGIVLFSGSLYAMTLSGVRALGAVTPFGGLCFIAGWLVVAFTAGRTP